MEYISFADQRDAWKRRAEAAEARAVELEAANALMLSLGKRLIDRVLDAANLSLPDALDVELSLMRIIGERDTLRAQLAAEEAAHRDDVAALRAKLERCAKDARHAIMSIRTGTEEARDWTLADLRGLCASKAYDAILKGIEAQS